MGTSFCRLSRQAPCRVSARAENLGWYADLIFQSRRSARQCTRHADRSHPAYAAQTCYVDLGSGGATANFALVPEGVIEGVVHDLYTKQPVAGAMVHARHDALACELAEAGEQVVRSGDQSPPS
jgi:hypothetical protein